MSDRVILCMKWGTKFGPEYVNNLHAMVRRQLDPPFRFICLTDDDRDLAPGIEALPIPDLHLPAGAPERGWKKLTTFEADLHGLCGRALFLDLDVVIVDRLDPFFEHPGTFLIIHDWLRPSRIEGNSSVYRFELGAHSDVIAHLRDHFDAVRASFRHEQAYLSDFLHEQGRLSYWPDEWCVSYKRRCIPRGLKKLWQTPAPPPGARIVIFHGRPNPHEAVAGRGNKWYRPARPARWIAEHWDVPA